MKAALRRGAIAGQLHLTKFQDLIAQLLAACKPLDAVVDSDSAVAIFPKVDEAILCGERAFRAVFDSEGPMWMRGVIVGCPAMRAANDLETERQVHGVKILSPAQPLLDALVAEKSGFSGFRLQVRSSLLTPQARASLKRQVITEEPYDAVPAPTAELYRTRKLDYAGSSDSEFEDVLWMLDDEPEFNRRDEDLSHRLRRSGGDPEEARHAAMTKVVFEEVRAIAGIVRR